MRSDELKKGLFEDVETLLREIGKATKIVPLLKLDEEALLGLLEKKGSLSIKELRSILNLDAYKVSRILESLENFYMEGKKTSLVKRNVDPRDKRQWRISLTPQGKAVLEKNTQRRAQRLEILFRPLDKNELADLAKLVRKMRENLGLD